MAYLLLGFVVVASPTLVAANGGFLQHSPEQTLTPEQRSAVLAAIEDALGEKHRQATEVRLAPLVEMLAPTLKALPKNEYGKFGHKAARYALHRLFVQRHAWFVKGIELDQNWNNASAAEILKEGVPGQVQALFEARLGSHGLSAHEVAVMAATFESLVHDEAMERLHFAYNLTKVSPGATSLTPTVVDEVLDVYTAIYVSPVNRTHLLSLRNGARAIVKFADKYYQGFAALRSFARQVRNDFVSGRDTLSSVDVARVVARFGDKYGRWQNYECEDLKRKLLSIEDDGTGRVSLSKFYNAALNHGHWQFGESSEFLRSMGALDETNPMNPRVIITNYVLAPSNCVASSKYYSVCCIDECEDLVDQLERDIQAPAATAARITELVSAMPSSTTRGKHTISPQLLGRLGEIAADNEGMVPLHGRMFAQWMHHVYPRECPFPHLSGTKVAIRAHDFESQTGFKPVASEDDMKRCVAGAAGMEESGELSWSTEDELYVERPAATMISSESSTLRSIVRFVAFFVVVLSMVGYLLGQRRMAIFEVRAETFSKEYV